MNYEIVSRLVDIEKRHNVRVLLAVESGSRVWGFASTNSDYDVRFIYARPQSEYLAITERRDVIEEMSEDHLFDLSGWDIKKALNLFKKSNPPLMEWLHSPIIYMEQGDTADRLRALSEGYFNPIAGMMHYFHMAKGNWKDYLNYREEVRLKKYFYVLRPLLACRWIEKWQSIPHTGFDALLYDAQVGNSVRLEINQLLQRKMSGEELDTGPSIKVIDDFIAEEIRHFDQVAEKTPSTVNGNTQILNDIFREAIQWKN